MKLFIKILLAAILLAYIAFTSYKMYNQPKTAYVDLTKLYDGFEYKKELEKQLTKVQEARQNILDSLELKLKVMSKQLTAATTKDAAKLKEFTELKEEYLTKKDQYDTDNEETTTTYTSQIWKQLSQYVQDYGKANKYTYIFGAAGSGSLMYANSSEDITDVVLVYVNEQYKGMASKITTTLK
jgi:outer membrane protein